MYSSNIGWAWYMPKYTGSGVEFQHFSTWRIYYWGPHCLSQWIHILAMHSPVFIAKDPQVCMISYFWKKNLQSILMLSTCTAFISIYPQIFMILFLNELNDIFYCDCQFNFYRFDMHITILILKRSTRGKTN